MKKIFYKINNFFSGNWRLAVLDLKAGRWTIRADPSKVAYLKAENANGKHILLQPENESCYMLADDLPMETLKRHHTGIDGVWRPGRMVVETSPGNYQVWIRSSRPLSYEKKRYWLKRMHSDPGAAPKNRWGRMPGFRNRKEKYKTGFDLYPLSRLIWVDWAKPAVIPMTTNGLFQNNNTQCQTASPICRRDYDKGNESVTDFSYALALARRGCDEAYIIDRILEERQNWGNHQGGKRRQDYLSRTVEKAIKIIAAS